MYSVNIIQREGSIYANRLVKSAPKLKVETKKSCIVKWVRKCRAPMFEIVVKEMRNDNIKSAQTFYVSFYVFTI